MTSDKMVVKILPDGTIQVITDEISQPNHMSAEAFLREIAIVAGGDVEKVRRAMAHEHAESGVTHTH